MSSNTRKQAPKNTIATVAQGQGETIALRTKHSPATRNPVRTAWRTELRCIHPSISGAKKVPRLTADVTVPPIWSPRPFWTA